MIRPFPGVAHAELEAHAADLAARPRLAFRAATETLDTGTDGHDAARAVARRSLASLVGTDAQRERTAEFLDKSRDGRDR